MDRAAIPIGIFPEFLDNISWEKIGDWMIWNLFFTLACFNVIGKYFFLSSDLFNKLGYQLNVSSWPMFLLRTLNGSEMAPATFFKKVSKRL